MKLSKIIFLMSVLLLGACSDNEETDSSADVMYHHNFRPYYHYTPQANWMNDPNGMVYYDGKYHLFYQYYPNGTTWGPMHWAHTVSTDLFHWEDQGIKLYPDELGYIFSGSAVADLNNTAGFKTGSETPLVAIFTHHQNITGRQVQSLAYSNDKGDTWAKYENNPVLDNPGIADFRDPKVIWHEATQRWIMVLAVYDHIRIYSSPDLKAWELESEFGKIEGYHGGVWECPDLFPLKDEQGTEKWVMLVSLGGNEYSEPNGGSATQYFIGEFDGSSFVSENDEILWADYGIDNYAGVTWSNIPETDGRRLFIGWMSNWAYANVVPESGWRSGMTVPREIKLKKRQDNRYILHFSPVDELNTLVDPQKTIAPETPANQIHVDYHEIIAGGSYQVEMEIIPAEIDQFTISLGNELEDLTISYSTTDGEFTIDRSNSGHVTFNNLFMREIRCDYQATGATLPLTLLVDQNSVELFINQGEKVMTALFFPRYNYKFLRLDGNTQSKFVKSLTIKALKKSMIR
ncbi:MAG: glycoside hydrolase family 32 protein [Mangrovibacterium sp.]